MLRKKKDQIERTLATVQMFGENSNYFANTR